MDIWKNIPVEIIGNKNYNKITGKVAGEPQQKGEEPCIDAEIKQVNAYVEPLNLKHRAQISLLIQFLAVSSDEQQKKQYLDQLLKEI